MKAGDVFRFVGIAEIHTWMIISDPALDPSKVLIVNFTSDSPDVDQACLMAIGEHPFIQNRTRVDYGRARVTTDAALETLKASGRLVLSEPLNQQLLTRIRESAMLSTRIKIDDAQILEDQELVD